MSRRRKLTELIDAAVCEAFGADARVGPINWGDSHRRMLLYNRRHERAFQRSRRNQPARRDGSGIDGGTAGGADV